MGNKFFNILFGLAFLGLIIFVDSGIYTKENHLLFWFMVMIYTRIIFMGNGKMISDYEMATELLNIKNEIKNVDFSEEEREALDRGRKKIYSNFKINIIFGYIYFAISLYGIFINL